MRCKISTESAPQENAVRILTDFEPAGPGGISQSCVVVAVDEQGYASPELWATALRMAADKIEPDGAAALSPDMLVKMTKEALSQLGDNQTRVNPLLGKTA